MIRHIFIASIKEGVTDSEIQKEMELMRSMKNELPEIKEIIVEKSKGWIGLSDVVTMTIDVESKQDFDKVIQSVAHQKVSATAPDFFRTDNFILTQIEYEKE